MTTYYVIQSLCGTHWLHSFCSDGWTYNECDSVDDALHFQTHSTATAVLICLDLRETHEVTEARQLNLLLGL